MRLFLAKSINLSLIHLAIVQMDLLAFVRISWSVHLLSMNRWPLSLYRFMCNVMRVHPVRHIVRWLLSQPLNVLKASSDIRTHISHLTFFISHRLLPMLTLKMNWLKLNYRVEYNNNLSCGFVAPNPTREYSDRRWETSHYRHWNQFHEGY